MLLSLLLSIVVLFNGSDIWDTLCDVKYKYIFDPQSECFIIIPKSNPKIRRLRHKEVTIQGYKATRGISSYEQLELNSNRILLCRYQESQFTCLFRPTVEAYIEIESSVPLELEVGKCYVFEGIFEWNKKDQSRTVYRLEKAKCLNC